MFPSQPTRVFDPVPQFSYTSSASEITLNFGSLVKGERLTIDFAAAAVPEPASWAMLIGGFGMAGAAMRRRTRVRLHAIA